jgi:hypothetical protein
MQADRQEVNATAPPSIRLVHASRITERTGAAGPYHRRAIRTIKTVTDKNKPARDLASGV